MSSESKIAKCLGFLSNSGINASPKIEAAGYGKFVTLTICKIGRFTKKLIAYLFALSKILKP